MGLVVTRLAAAVLALATAFAGCASSNERKVLTEQELETMRTAEMESASRQKLATMNEIADRLSRDYEEYKAGRRSSPPQLDILAISGGGDFGAFAAGVLVGWGQVADEAKRRPRFDAVSGVSTGGLIAPFAFIGTDEACGYVENFYRNPKDDWVRTRGPLFFLPDNPSFMSIPGLERDIRLVVSKEFVRDVAQGRRDGRLLAISATNLDLSSQRAWEVGQEAVQAEESGNYDRITKILLATAAIPIVFPPVEIDGFLYADGGVTANVLLALDADSPNALLNVWRRRFPDRPLPRIRYWIIVNNWRRAPPKTIHPRWPNVVSPSLATSIRSATLSEIRWLTAQARFINSAYQADIEVRMLAIPEAWRPPVEGDFKKETMESLADMGRKMGADPASWRLLASPATSRAVDPEEPKEPS